MIPNLTLCSLDRFCRMVDAYNYISRVVNILTFICLSKIAGDDDVEIAKLDGEGY